MTEFTLKQREEDVLKLNIGEESFMIPLATSLTLEEATAMETMDGAIAFFKKHIKGGIAETLTLANFRDIIEAWNDASRKASGKGEPTPGES